MSLQLIEAYVPKKYFEKVDPSLQDFTHVSYWVTDESEDRFLVRILVKTEHSEEILTYFEKVANLIDGFEIILVPVHSFITRTNKEEEEERKKQEKEEEKNKIQRASRHELYDNVTGSGETNLTYLLFVIFSAIVVTVGLVRNSVAIIIGGMVIAPLLGPVIAISFAAVLGDFKLIRKSGATFFYGIFSVFLISILVSWVFSVPTESEEFLARTRVEMTDIALALASGAAGALATLKRVSSGLVGVMVAVALLPPSVVFGMSVGAWMVDEAIAAGLLLLVNISSLLLSAVVVFTVSGIRPVKYKEIKRASQSQRYAIFFISLIVLLLVGAILYSNRFL